MEEPSEKEIRVNLRLGTDLLTQLDREVDRLEREQPGPRWSRSSVARMALIQHLRAVADEHAAA